VQVGELVAQRAARLVQPGLDGAGPCVELPGDLGVAEVGKVEELDRRALAGRKRADRVADARGDGGRLGGSCGPGRPSGCAAPSRPAHRARS